MAFFVLSGIALSVKFSISWSEISANGHDAIVFYFPHIVNSRFSLAIHNCRLLNNYSPKAIFTEPEANNCFSIISELNKRE